MDLNAGAIGAVEGHVNRIKSIKDKCIGRACFDPVKYEEFKKKIHCIVHGQSGY